METFLIPVKLEDEAALYLAMTTANKIGLYCKGRLEHRNTKEDRALYSIDCIDLLDAFKLGEIYSECKAARTIGDITQIESELERIEAAHLPKKPTLKL